MLRAVGVYRLVKAWNDSNKWKHMQSDYKTTLVADLHLNHVLICHVCFGLHTQVSIIICRIHSNYIVHACSIRSIKASPGA